MPIYFSVFPQLASYEQCKHATDQLISSHDGRVDVSIKLFEIRRRRFDTAMSVYVQLPL